jgi:hypothetical protein
LTRRATGLIFRRMATRPEENSMLKAILIDPATRSITEVEYQGVYTDIYALIKNDGSPFDVRSLRGTNSVVYFDDEFLLKVKKGDTKPYVFINGVPDPLGGRALIVGTDGGGNDIDTELTVEDFEDNVRFQDLTFLGWEPGYQKEVDHPTYGKVSQIVGPRPRFRECDVSGTRRDVEDIKEDNKHYDARKAAMKQLADFFEDKLHPKPSPSVDFFMDKMKGKK